MISRLIYFSFFKEMAFGFLLVCRLQRISRSLRKSREIPFSPDRDGRELRISY